MMLTRALRAAVGGAFGLLAAMASPGGTGHAQTPGTGELWENVKDTCKKGGYQVDNLADATRHGAALAILGQSGDANQNLRTARISSRNAGNREPDATVIGALGNIALRQGDFDTAEKLFRCSIADAGGDRSVLAISHNNLGNVLALRHKPDQSPEQTLQETIEQFDLADQTAEPGSWLQAQIAIGRARARLRRKRPGDIASAASDLDRAAKIILTIPGTGDRVTRLTLIAGVGLSPGGGTQVPDVALSERLLRQALADATELRDVRGQSQAEGTLALLLESEYAPPAEVKLWLAKAITDAQSFRGDDLLWRWDWLAGRLALAENDRQHAIEAYRNAVASLQAVRSGLWYDDNEDGSAFSETDGLLYYKLADLLFAEARTKFESGPREKLLKETLSVIETFRSNEVRDFLGKPCLAPDASSAKPDAQPRDTVLEPHEAVLYPILLEDRVELLIKLPDDSLWFVHEPPKKDNGSQVTEADVKIKVKEFLAEIRTEPAPDHKLQAAISAPCQYKLTLKDGTVSLGKAAQDLYRWLIRPVNDQLVAAKTTILVVVPDGVLRTVPFAALIDGEAKCYLIDKIALAVVPSLHLTDLTPASHDRHLLAAGVSVSIRKADDREPHSPLEYAPDEVRQVHRQMPDWEPLIDETHMKDKILDALEHEPVTILHLAMHAEFGGTRQNSILWTGANEPLTLDSLAQAVSVSRYHAQSLDLLVLSACETAEGNDRQSLGVAGVTVQSGAHSAIASLWAAEEGPAVELMPDFYEQWGSLTVTRTKAEALRVAQLHLIAGRSPPQRWAPFMLVGSWR
jgi:CHAT domain-containing protein